MPLHFVSAHEPTLLTAVSHACRVNGCDRTARARGLCVAHYHRLLRHGDVGDPYVRPVYADDEPWDCTCAEPIIGANGECQRCHRKPLALMEANRR